MSRKVLEQTVLEAKKTTDQESTEISQKWHLTIIASLR